MLFMKPLNNFGFDEEICYINVIFTICIYDIYVYVSIFTDQLPNNCPGKDVFERMNFLYQVSTKIIKIILQVK